MIGYHYTSEENWLKIRNEGLVPYPIKKEAVADGTPGIWVFTNKQDLRSHVGCIWFQLITKQQLVVVQMAVQYEERDIRHPWKNYTLDVSHDGWLVDRYGKNFTHYHLGAKAAIIWNPVPVERIQLLGTYRFEEAWGQFTDEVSLSLLESASVKRMTP